MPPVRSRRQQPASCEQCRKKKLKCDRLPICGNCRARDLQCTYVAPAFGSPDAPATIQVQELEELHVENAAIRSRLEHLETFMLQHKREDTTSSHGASDSYLDAGPSSPPGFLPADGDRVPKSVKPVVGDSGWRETISMSYYKRIPTLPHSLNIEIRPLQQLLFHASSSTAKSQLIILLPTRQEAERLLDTGLDRLALIQHLIYRPNIASLLRQVYEQIETSQSHRFSHVVLLLALLASIANSCGYSDEKDSIFDTASDAGGLSAYWSKSALDLLEQAFRSEPSDLTTVQATIIAVFLTFYSEALSTRTRILHSTAVAVAKDIGLHTTDGDFLQSQILSREQIVEREMRRRVWWHLVATDWSLALCGGQQDGTYTIHPRHMRTLKPRNINDEELMTMPTDFSHQPQETTRIAYFLHRIRLGEICREVADLTWDLTGSDIDEFPYAEVIIPLDRKFEHLLDDLPAQLSGEDVQQTVSFISRSMASQRHLTTFSIQARRCKLHLPFLLRASRNKRYEFSRSTCLRAARNMLDFGTRTPSSERYAIGTEIPERVMVFHHFFCATVVLVMDLSMNRTAGPEEERKAEIQAACNILEDARQYSGSAGVLLETLMDIMHKHKVRLQTQDQDLQISNGKSKLVSESQVGINDGLSVLRDMTLAPAAENLDFGDLWQSYLDMGPDINPREWDALFADLDGSV